jgi:hypothetical protein
LDPEPEVPPEVVVFPGEEAAEDIAETVRVRLV